jgi:hypothetical protein
MLKMVAEFNQDTLSQQAVYCTVLEDFSHCGAKWSKSEVRLINSHKILLMLMNHSIGWLIHDLCRNYITNDVIWIWRTWRFQTWIFIWSLRNASCSCSCLKEIDKLNGGVVKNISKPKLIFLIQYIPQAVHRWWHIAPPYCSWNIRGRTVGFWGSIISSWQAGYKRSQWKSGCQIDCKNCPKTSQQAALGLSASQDSRVSHAFISLFMAWILIQ